MTKSMDASYGKRRPTIHMDSMTDGVISQPFTTDFQRPQMYHNFVCPGKTIASHRYIALLSKKRPLSVVRFSLPGFTAQNVVYDYPDIWVCLYSTYGCDLEKREEGCANSSSLIEGRAPTVVFYPNTSDQLGDRRQEIVGYSKLTDTVSISVHFPHQCKPWVAFGTYISYRYTMPDYCHVFFIQTEFVDVNAGSH